FRAPQQETLAESVFVGEQTVEGVALVKQLKECDALQGMACLPAELPRCRLSPAVLCSPPDPSEGPRRGGKGDVLIQGKDGPLNVPVRQAPVIARGPAGRLEG